MNSDTAEGAADPASHQGICAGDIEALMIQTLDTQMRGNLAEMRFAAAQRWTQIKRHEIDTYLRRVARAPLPP